MNVTEDFIEKDGTLGGCAQIGQRVTQIEQFFGPADRYETYAPFFLKVALLAGENVFDHTDKEDHRKLKSFAAVDSH